jgi:putative chitinase
MTENELQQLEIDGAWLEPLNATFERFDINTPLRQACFIGQCGHESEHFRFLEENLNYKAESLMRVWPTHFNHELAQECAHSPQRIADIAYAHRMGNGGPETGDGFNYRGRGLIQLTGKNNYRTCGEAIGVDLVNNPDYVATPEGACLSAGWFWQKHGLNELADANEVEEMTERINGGTLGLENRIALMQQALDVLA